jgi:hypothetical protein
MIHAHNIDRALAWLLLVIANVCVVALMLAGSHGCTSPKPALSAGRDVPPPPFRPPGWQVGDAEFVRINQPTP